MTWTVDESSLSQQEDLTSAERQRYSRHLLLSQVGVEGQRRWKNGSVLCVGAGGLGSPALTYLAAAGVGRLGVVDFDAVDESNLQRQILHDTSSVGRPKVDSAVDRLAALNPHVRVEPHPEAISRDNVLDLVRAYDVVVDGTDNFPTRYLLSDACELSGKPYVYGAVFRFEGHASVFNHAGGPTYRDLYPEPPAPGTVPTCAEAGVVGVLPGIIGSIQAMEALKLLAGIGESLSGRLLVFDALHMTFRELKLRKDPSREAVRSLADVPQTCSVDVGSDAAACIQVSAGDLKRRWDAGWRPFILDVRSPLEADIVSLPHVDRCIPHTELAHHLHALPKDRDIVVICKSGARSAFAANFLMESDFTRVYDVAGGVLAWRRDVDPSLPVY